MPVSTYTSQKLNQHILRNTAWAPPVTIWVGLFLAEAGLDTNSPGSYVEVSGASYSRLEIGGATGRSFTDAVMSVNNEAWEWALATENWGAISHVGILDSDVAESNNSIQYGVMSPAKTINVNDQFRLLPGEIQSLFS